MPHYLDARVDTTSRTTSRAGNASCASSASCGPMKRRSRTLPSPSFLVGRATRTSSPRRSICTAAPETGLRILGLDSKRETIEIQELPAAIRRLAPGEAEDLLCIYKKRFGPVRQRGDDPQ